MAGRGVPGCSMQGTCHRRVDSGMNQTPQEAVAWPCMPHGPARSCCFSDGEPEPVPAAASRNRAGVYDPGPEGSAGLSAWRPRCVPAAVWTAPCSLEKGASQRDSHTSSPSVASPSCPPGKTGLWLGS